MRATTEPLEGNLVRLSVEIDEPEFDRALVGVVKTLASQIRVPGFRPGKVPRKVLEARMGGAGALRAEALRESLPDFYARAVVDSEIDPIASPEIDITAGEESGARQLRRRGPGAAGGVHPRLRRVAGDPARPRASATRTSTARSTACGRTTPSSSRSAARPSTATWSPSTCTATTPAAPRWWGSTTISTRWGRARSPPSSTWSCAAPRPVTSSPSPRRLRANEDEVISFRVLVKDVKVKKLPEPTDEWAAESSEFATVAELRADISERMARVKLVQSQMALREKTVEAVAGLVDDGDVPEVLVDAEVNERLHDLQHRLEAQKLGLGEYLQATGRTPDDLLAAVRVDAQRAVKADLALRALAEAEELTVSDEELDAEIATMAQRMETSPAELRRQLDTAGRTGAVRSELRKGKALQWLLDHVELFDEEGNPMSRDDLKTDAAKESEENE